MANPLKEYVAFYHDELNKMYDEIKTYCLIKGYIELELLEDWDTIDYTLTALGEAWLYHTPDAGKQALSAATGSVEHPEYCHASYTPNNDDKQTYRHAIGDFLDETACKEPIHGVYLFEVLHTMEMCPYCIAARIETRDNVGKANTATPAAANAGYTVEPTPLGFKLYAPSGGFMCAIEQGDMQSIEDVLNGETESLRSETRTLRDQLATAQLELAQARERMDRISNLARKGLNASHSGISEDTLKTIRKLAEND